MTTLPKERLHGTLDALVLKTLSAGPRHGYAIARSIEEATADVIQVEEGSLYPALYRMEKRGWIEAGLGNVRYRPESEALSAHHHRQKTAPLGDGRMEPVCCCRVARSHAFRLRSLMPRAIKAPGRPFPGSRRSRCGQSPAVHSSRA